LTRPSSAPRSKASRSTPRPSSLPETRAFEWWACGVRTLVSQYLAFRPPPPELEAIAAAASDLFDAARSGNWQAAASADRALARAWTAHRRGGVPPRIAVEMNRAFAALGRAIGARNRTDAANAAIDVAQSAPDIELRYRPPAEIDQARFEL
jgi:hypothetical protein